MIIRHFKLFFPKRVISIFKICQHVFILNERDSKLLTIYNFDYLDHTYVNYHVTEKVYAKLKLKILKLHTFVPKRIISTL